MRLLPTLRSTSENKRFDGTIDVLCSVKVQKYVDWLATVPHEEWNYLGDSARLGWDRLFQPMTDKLLSFYPGGYMPGVGIWRLDPGQIHPSHTDIMADGWLVRIHVPLLTNKGVIFTMDDGEYHMKVGKAYRFNPTANHEVENRGDTPRFHYVTDIWIR